MSEIVIDKLKQIIEISKINELTLLRNEERIFPDIGNIKGVEIEYIYLDLTSLEAEVTVLDTIKNLSFKDIIDNHSLEGILDYLVNNFGTIWIIETLAEIISDDWDISLKQAEAMIKRQCDIKLNSVEREHLSRMRKNLGKFARQYETYKTFSEFV